MNKDRLGIYAIYIFIIPFIFLELSMLICLTYSLIFYRFDPVFETATCRNNRCTTVENYIIFTRGPWQVIKNKSELEIQTIPDNTFHINQYYIRMRNNNGKYLFRTGYLTRSAAERDLIRIKENDNITITKRNVIFINFFFITLYIMLLIIVYIINRKRQYSNNNPALNMQNTEEQNRARQNYFFKRRTE